MLMSKGENSRLRSLFAEPAAFAVYVVLALGIELLGKEKNDKKTILILTVGLLLSGSSTAILMVGILYAVFVWKNITKLSKKTMMRLIGFFFLVIIILPIFTKTQAFKIFYNRTLVYKDATEGRFGNYGVVLKDLDNIKLFFGRGILKIEGYIPTLPRIFFYYGIIGIVFFIIVSVRNFKKLKGIQWITWLVLLALMFPTEIFFGNFMMLYMPFMNEVESKGEKDNEAKIKQLQNVCNNS